MKYGKRLALAALILFGAVGLTCAAVASEVYTWTDEDGVVHFSDREPVGRDANLQELPDTTPSSGPNPYEESQAGKCEAWRAEVARLEPNRRVFFTNEQGETERMDDVDRTNRVAELKSMIAQNCR